MKRVSLEVSRRIVSWGSGFVCWVRVSSDCSSSSVLVIVLRLGKDAQLRDTAMIRLEKEIQPDQSESPEATHRFKCQVVKTTEEKKKNRPGSFDLHISDLRASLNTEISALTST